MAGALAEFSRRPPGTRAAIYAGIAGALGLLYFQFGLAPVRKSVASAENDLKDAVSDARKLAGDKKKQDELRATQAELRKQIDQNQRALPTDAEMPAFFDMLARKFSEAGVQVNHREVKKEIAVDNFVKAPVEIEIVGTYYQIKQFFASLRPHADAAPSADGPDSDVGAADKDRIVTIEDISVFDPRVVQNQLMMTAKFTASTFRTVIAAPATPATATPAAGAATKPATGANTGGDPAVAPSPLKPSDAKKAAEDAYRKGDERARDAAASAGDPLPPEPAPTPGRGSGLDRIKGGGL